MADKESWLTKNRLYRVIGAALICCALGLSIGGLVVYSKISNNLIGLSNEHGVTQVIDKDNKIVFFQTHYLLGDTPSDKYSIVYNNIPETIITNRYRITGSFTNETDNHFAAISLDFSLLDEDGHKIGDAHASCEGLNSKQTWNFSAVNREVLETDSKVVSAILDDIRITY